MTESAAGKRALRLPGPAGASNSLESGRLVACDSQLVEATRPPRDP